MTNTLLEEKVETQVQPSLDTPWSVVVMNDPVNLMSYVVMIFMRIFGFSKEKATRHMKEVHEGGRSILWSGAREEAEHYTHVLQQWQLNCRLEHNA